VTVAHCEKRLCPHMVSPQVFAECIFSIIYEGGERLSGHASLPISCHHPKSPDTQGSQNPFSPQAISSARDPSDATFQH
jgi:hypothetical protein